MFAGVEAIDEAASGSSRMKANRAYQLIVSREGLEPAFLADPDRIDRIEVVSIDDGEVILFWDLPARTPRGCSSCSGPTSSSLEAEEFFDKWPDADAEDF